MKIKEMVIPFMAVGILLSGLVIGNAAFADEDERGERGESGERHERGERGERGGKYVVVENAVYKKECSDCHFLYLPGLLPVRSWEKVMNETDKHFGEKLSLDEKTKSEILLFLTANSAEKTKTEWASKITRSVGSDTPSSITEIPYIAKEHRKIKEDVFKRASIGSRSNCGACHPHAEHGDFEEDSVSIPK